MPGYVYILASKRNGTLYISVTHNLVRRICEHKEGCSDGFTQRYQVKLLVYDETYAAIVDAIAREKTLKHLHRHKKLALIEINNPDWQDLYDELA